LLLSENYLTIQLQIAQGEMFMTDQKEFYAAFFRSRPLLFIITAGGFMVWWIVWLIDARSRKLTIANGRIIYSHGILSKNATECKLERVSSVQVTQTLGQRIFGCGDVIVNTAGDVPEITAQGFVNPNKIKQMIDSQS
jgi:uncharacterized membrane protein YdbT with pleckstrin-like domain